MNWDSLKPQFPSADSWPIQDLNDLTVIWVAGTIFVAALALLWASWKTSLSLLRTARYSRLMTRFKSPEELMAHRSRWELDMTLPLARDYSEMLVEVPKEGSPLERELRRCGIAADVFNPTTLAPGLVGSRLLLAIPAILTGLGVLGTFVGLQLGIKELDLSFTDQPPTVQTTPSSPAPGGVSETGDQRVQIMMRSVSELVAGCSTAFATSVWGVLCSLIFTILEKFFEWLALLRIRRFQSRLDSLVRRYNPEDSMIELHRSAAEREHILKGLAVAIGEQMQTAMNRLGSSITEAVKDALGSQAQDLGKMSADLMSKALTEELGKLQSAVTGMADGFKEEFSKASNQLGTTICGFETVLNGIDSSVQSSRTALNQAVERLNAHETVVKHLDEGAKRLQEAAGELASLRDTFALSAQRNAEAAAAQEKAANVNENVAAKLERVGDKLPEVQSAISEGARIIGTLGQPLLDLKDILDRTPALFGEQAEQQAKRDEQRTSVLLAQTQTLVDAVAEAATKFAQVESLATSLEGSAAKLEQAGTALGNLANSIQKASEHHEMAANFTQIAAVAGEKAAEKLSPIPDSLESLTSSLTSASGRIKEGAEAARHVYDQLLQHQKDWYRGVELGLGAMRDRVQEILKAYGSSVEEETKRQMQQWIAAVDDSLRRFSTQIQALEGFVSDLSSNK